MFRYADKKTMCLEETWVTKFQVWKPLEPLKAGNLGHT